MSILSWLKTVTEGSGQSDLIDTGSMKFAEGEEQFHGLDMKGALDAHMAWTRRLEGKIEGSNNEELDIATVASDCECALGKWLHGTAKGQFGASGEFNDLVQIHADFHLKAGEILNNVTNGNHDEAQNNLKELRYQSGNVQLALIRLYSHSQH